MPPRNVRAGTSDDCPSHRPNPIIFGFLVVWTQPPIANAQEWFEKEVHTHKVEEPKKSLTCIKKICRFRSANLEAVLLVRFQVGRLHRRAARQVDHAVGSFVGSFCKEQPRSLEYEEPPAPILRNWWRASRKKNQSCKSSWTMTAAQYCSTHAKPHRLLREVALEFGVGRVISNSRRGIYEGRAGEPASVRHDYGGVCPPGNDR